MERKRYRSERYTKNRMKFFYERRYSDTEEYSEYVNVVLCNVKSSRSQHRIPERCETRILQDFSIVSVN